MPDHRLSPSKSTVRLFGTLLSGGMLAWSAGDSAALSLSQKPLAPSAYRLIEDDRETHPAAPFAELNQALAAARDRLQQLSDESDLSATMAELRDAIQAARDDNVRLTKALSAAQSSNAELRRTNASADVRITELTATAEEAASEAQRIDEELVAMRWQTAQLRTSLNQAEAARQAADDETEQARAELAALKAATQRSATEIARLQNELAASRQDIAAVTDAKSQIEARLAEAQQALAQLQDTGGAVAQAQNERDFARDEATALRRETELLSAEIALVKAEVDNVRATNADLEQQVSALRSAASAATDAAQQNLSFVETHIRELTAALGTREPNEAASDDAAGKIEAGAIDAGKLEASPVKTGPVASQVETIPIKAVPVPELRSPTFIAAHADTAFDRIPRPTPAREELLRSAPVNGDLQVLKTGYHDEGAAPQTLAAVTAALPLEARVQVQNLLADLDAVTDQEGLKMTVPGAELFTIDSQQIEPSAHDALAKVAELINVYDGREVLILGHTDAIGRASYNQTLSEQRARLVRQFFVEHFDIDPARLSTRGHGEEQPIASNETVRGRQANRRVEVMILN